MSESTLREQELPSWAVPMKGESVRAFNAWCCYRDLPPEVRSLDRAWRVSRGDRKGNISKRAPGRWRFWSVRYSWRQRALAYDGITAQRAVLAEMQKMESEGAARAERRLRAEESLLEVAEAFQKHLGDLLAHPLERDREELSLDDLAKILKMYHTFVSTLVPLSESVQAVVGNACAPGGGGHPLRNPNTRPVDDATAALVARVADEMEKVLFGQEKRAQGAPEDQEVRAEPAPG
jgi:hypothetical protein